MTGIGDIISAPQFLLSIGLIVGVTLLALRFTAPARRRARGGAGPEEGHRPLSSLDHGPPVWRRAHMEVVAADGDAVAERPAKAVAGGTAPERPPRLDDDAEHPKVTFADVAGLEEAIAELREVRDFLADPARFQALGAELPRGILLHGQPGCGKTLLARALAGEAGVPFYFVSAASFVEKYVGLGAARVRDLFAEAKRNAPSIIFIDELDAVGRSRNGDTGGAREFDNTLNQLLIELDGFAGSSGVLLLGATNRAELIDPALLRPGRFDRRIQIDPPDKQGREKILRLHASRRPFSGRVDWAEVAADTAGLTAAELANIVNEASLLAARRHRPRISPEDVEEAAARVLSGMRNARLLGDEEKQLIAVHEAGHALLSMLVRGTRPPPRVSIVGRSGAFDKSVWSAGTEDRGIMTKRELMAQLILLLGGRAAEMNAFGEPSTRAEDDLEHAAVLARRMVERWAMTGRFELAASRPDGPAHYFEGSAGGAEVRALLARSEQAARTILRDNEETLSAIATTLAERETLSAAQLMELAGKGDGGSTLAPVRQIHAV